MIFKLCTQCDHFQQFYNRRNVKVYVPIIRWSHCDASNRSQCFKSHGVFDFTYKLQLHYNIYKLVFTIWMIKIIKRKIPLGSCKLYAERDL